ncbi:MAG: S49 family peptidase [Chthoniobacteraceae bacterium]
MKTQFINKLVSQSWNIPRARGRALLASMVLKLRDERPAESKYGDPLPKLSIMGDVAHIPITGALALNLPDWIKEYGLSLTDINDIEQELSQALNDPRVATIVLDFDSPGGWSIAGNKLFDLVEAAAQRKPVFAWCADGADLCSAAYQGAAPARMILAGRYALAVGCIGTYLTVLDDTEFWKQLGVTWEVFRSGELKGMGDDGWSEAQKKFLQDTVDTFGARFRGNVSRFRTSLPTAEMEGQYYGGEEAAQRLFIDGTSADLAGAIAKFRGL